MQKYKINRSRHAAFLLHVHLVFVTKYRRKILGELHCAAFHQYAAEVCRDFGAEPRQPGGCKLKTAPVRPVVAARPAEYVCSEDLF
ncbi:transposase, partial [Escherichia coli]